MSEPTSAAVAVRGVTKSFGAGPARVEALRGVDFEASAGEFTAVMGASGSGKSTLLHLIAGLTRPTAGSVLVGGVDLAALNDDRRTLLRRRRIGLVFQDFNLIDVLTAEENVALPLAIDGRPAAEAHRRARRALEAVGLRTAARTGPAGCPAGSSSGRRWPAPWPSSRSCFWPTSRPATLTAPAPPGHRPDARPGGRPRPDSRHGDARRRPGPAGGSASGPARRTGRVVIGNVIRGGGMRLWTYSLREAQRRPGRTLLTVLAVAVGTASLSATALTSQAARRAYRDLFERVSGPAALEAVGAGQGGFDPACAAGLTGAPGVKAIVPRVQAMAALAGPPASDPVLVVGVAPDPAAGGPGCRVVEGRWAAEGDEIALEAGCVGARRLALGDRVRLWTPAGLAELRLTGVLEEGAPGVGGGAYVAVVSLGTAQRLFCLPGQVNSLQILLHRGADAAAVQALLGPRLPPGVLIQSPARGRSWPGPLWRAPGAASKVWASPQCSAPFSWSTTPSASARASAGPLWPRSAPWGRPDGR